MYETKCLMWRLELLQCSVMTVTADTKRYLEETLQERRSQINYYKWEFSNRQRKTEITANTQNTEAVFLYYGI